MNIEEIMKSYFDKKEEISKRPEEFKNNPNELVNRYEEENNRYQEENNLYESEISSLKVRLENLRNNKDREIEEYVQNSVSDRPEFYAGYGAMIRKDLEQSYLKREKELEEQIELKEKELSPKISNNYLKIEANNKLIEAHKNYKYYNVDVRELVDVKHDLRKPLISAKKELELKLQEAELRFDTVMHKLSTFKYEYDENHNVINGNEYRMLFEQSNSLIEVKYNLQRDLKQIDEYLKLTELTEEEVKVVMMSMSDLEKEEYSRRKANVVNINVADLFPTIKVEEVETPEEVVTNEPVENKTEQIEVPQENISREPVIEIVPEEPDQRIYDYAKKAMDAQKEIEHNYSEFIDEIFGDVVGSVKKLRSIKLEDGKYLNSSVPGEESQSYEMEPSEYEQVELVNGLYLNEKDINKALNNYVKQNKGRNFTVKGIDLELNVTKKSVKKVKEFLRDASTKKLLIEKKLSLFDIKRVFGKKKTEKYNNSLRVDSSKVNMPAGTYVHVSDVCEAFKELFAEKTPTWLEKLTSKFKRNEVEEIVEVPDAEYIQVEDKMTWNAEEPEYEVVRAKTK